MTLDPAQPKAGLGGLQRRGFLAAFADGSIHFLPNTIDAKTLKALFTIAGGEVVAVE